MGRAVIKAVIFDCYGVVVGKGIWKTFELAGGDLSEHGEYLEKIIDREAVNKISRDEFIRAFAERVGMTNQVWNDFALAHDQPNLDTLSLVSKLKERGIKTALLSNASAGSVEQRLSEQQLSEFDAVIISGNVGFAKPDPKIFKHTCNLLGVVPTDCLFTDDHERYLEGARQAGLQAVEFKGVEKFKSELQNMLGVIL